MSQFVQDFYNNNAEHEGERLDQALGKVEYASTLRLIDEYFPAQGRICDIGGGPGRYTIELIRWGYAVTLFDLSEKEISLARLHLEQLRDSAERPLTGDARDFWDRWSFWPG